MRSLCRKCVERRLVHDRAVVDERGAGDDLIGHVERNDGVFDEVLE